MDKRLKLLLIAVTIGVVVTIVSVSYAFFTVSNKEGNITNITSATMGIEYDDGDEIIANYLIPGDHVDKTFRVRNTGSYPLKYDVFLDEIYNNFTDQSDLVYELISNDGGFNTSSQIQAPNATTKIVDGQALPISTTHTYTLRITFLSKNENQDDNQGKSFRAKIRINTYQDNPNNNDDPDDDSLISIADEDKDICNILTDTCDLTTVGSEVRIGSQPFYVYGSENGHPKLLAKYNLNIANGIYTEYDSVNDSYIHVNEGFQDIHARSSSYYVIDGVDYYEYGNAYISFFGDTSGSAPDYMMEGPIEYYYMDGDESCKTDPDFTYAGCRFAEEYRSASYNPLTNDPYENIGYVYTNQKSGEGYYLNGLAEPLENYKDYLNSLGVTVSARIISNEELETLGCHYNNTGSYNPNDCSSAPSWVYSTSYWTGSAFEKGSDILGIKSYGDEESSYTYYYSTVPDELGLRPVIILESY